MIATKDWPVYFGGERTFIYDRPKRAPKPPIPRPEVYARPATLAEMGSAAITFGKKARSLGWQLRVTYARGPLVSLDGEDVLSTADSILVVARKAGVWLAACWTHRDDSVKEGVPAGKWELSNCHVMGPFILRPRRVSIATLRIYLEFHAT